MQRRTKEQGTIVGAAGQTVGSLLTGMGVGAALMYFLDPRLGPYRRGIARDRTASFASRSVALAEKQARNARNHIQGLVAETRRAIRGEEPVSDRKLADRIRSKIGRVLLHPSQVEIEVIDGRVVAKGKLRHEHAQRVVSNIRRIRGVHAVDDRVERISPEGI
jgi:osmotically-inducible protein OsmY